MKTELIATGFADCVRAMAGSSNNLDIAVPFWGEGAVAALGLKRRGSRYRILLNLESGACRPSEVAKLLELLPVKTNARLHAKLFLTSHGALIGSANASANGLGLEGAELTAWKELCVLTREPHMIRAAQRWFDSIWDADDSRVPTAIDMQRAAETWELRRRNRPFITFPRKQRRALSIEELLSKNPRAFRDRPIHVVAWSAGASEAGEREAARYKRNQGLPASADYYEDGSKVIYPSDAWIIDVDQSDERPTVTAFWKTQSPPETRRFVNGGSYAWLTFVRRHRLAVLNDGVRLRLSDGDRRLIWGRVKRRADRDDMLVALDELVRG